MKPKVKQQLENLKTVLNTSSTIDPDGTLRTRTCLSFLLDILIEIESRKLHEQNPSCKNNMETKESSEDEILLAYTKKLRDDGSIVIPQSIREALGLEWVTLVVEKNGEIKIRPTLKEENISKEQMKKIVRAYFKTDPDFWQKYKIKLQKGQPGKDKADVRDDVNLKSPKRSVANLAGKYPIDLHGKTIDEAIDEAKDKHFAEREKKYKAHRRQKGAPDNEIATPPITLEKPKFDMKAYNKKYWAEHKAELSEKRREYYRKYWAEHKAQTKAKRRKEINPRKYPSYKERYDSNEIFRKKEIERKRRYRVKKKTELLAAQKNIDKYVQTLPKQEPKTSWLRNKLRQLTTK